MIDSQEAGRSRFRSSCLGCLSFILFAFATLWMAWQVMAFNHERERFPEAISVAEKIYENEKSWGFGPGGNETGLALYRLEKADAERLIQSQDRLETSEEIAAAMGRSRDHRDYREWHKTPFDPQEAGTPWSYSERGVGQFDIAEFLFRGGGFGIKVDDAAARDVNRILNSPGAYYATGAGSSLIVVAPRDGLIIYSFAG